MNQDLFPKVGLTPRRSQVWAVASFLTLLSNAALAAQLELRPVSATGGHSIVGDQITMQAGETVTLEAFLSGWGPAKLSVYQFRILSAGYTSGTAGSLTPVGWPGTPATGAFITTGRADYTFFGVSDIHAVDTSTPDYRYGATPDPANGRTDPGTPRYCGTLILNVSPDAAGTFTVSFDPDSGQTFLQNDQIPGVDIPLGVLTPATIVVKPPAMLAVTPVLATGEYSIAGNQISVHPGASVTLEARVSAWGPSTLRAYQFQIASSGFTSGVSGTLTPAGYPASPADGAYILQSRTDYVFFGQTANTTTNTTTLDYRYGGSLVPPGGVSDPGGDRYAATLVLNVSPDASGVFTVGLNPNPAETMLTDSNNLSIEPLTLFPAVISVTVSDCNNNGIPDSVDISNATSADCNGNLIPDECDIGTQPTGKKVYWIKDSNTNSIQRSNLDGTLVQTLYPLASSLSWGFAIDDIASKLYWTDPFASTIYRANLDGSGRIALLSALEFPAGFALDLSAKKMYWTEAGGISKIRRANLDGSGVEDVVIVGVFSSIPVALALDIVGKKIYWTEEPGAIKRANLDGTDVETLVTSGLESPEGMALDTAFKKIYWTDRTADVIRRANMDGTNVEDLISAGLVCPQGIAVDPTGGKIYWADVCGGSDVIQRANLNGTGVEVLCHTPSPMAIALDLTQPDCNLNGIPDDCDLASCPGTPSCGDCNLNGLLDGCDIATGVSLDVNPVNGIPDECVKNQSPSGNWSDNIWSLSGVNPAHPYPDNQAAVPNRRVTLDGTTVSLNVSAQIDGLRLTNGAQLTATQSGAQGDLTFAFPGEVVTEAQILVDHRRIGEAVGNAVRPSFVIGPSGEYVANSLEGAPSASLLTTDLTIQGASCEMPCRGGGKMTLRGTMSADVSGNFLMDGQSAVCSGPCAAARLGGVTPPPKLRFLDRSTIALAGNFVLRGNVLISAGGAAAIGLSGSVVNYSTVPGNFDFLEGSLSLNGSITRIFEVAGIDYGATTQGYFTGEHTNYSMGTLELGPGAYVEFVNRFPNVAPLAPCSEALYVRRLIFGAGSTVVIDNCNVYYQSLESNGVTPTLVGACAGFHPVPIPAPPNADGSGINNSRSLAMSVPASVTASGVHQALRVTLSSLHHVNPPYTGGESVPFTSLEGQVLWVGPPTQYVESVSNSIPFYAAALQCTPHYRDWSTVGLFFVTGPEIVPGSIYNVQIIDEGADNSNPASFSLPLAFGTSRWGDVVATFQDPNQAASQPDFDDIGALLNKFKSALGAPIKARAKLAGVDARGLIDITPDVGFDDISLDVDAFKGVPYPYKPGKCMGAQTTVCITDTDCGANGPCILCP